MDNSKKQDTNIQEQPENVQDIISNKPIAFPKNISLAVDLFAKRALGAFKDHFDREVFTRYVLVPFAVLLILGGFLYWRLYLNGFNAKSVSVGGYSYSFNFLRSAKFVQNSNGMRGYGTDSDHSAMVGPLSGLPQLCGLKGSPYIVAFTVEIDGAMYPVCTTQDSQDEQIYTLNFTAQNQYHEFMVTYGYSQNANTNQTLKSIFESINVSK